MTAETTDTEYLWPARHEAGSVTTAAPADGRAVPAEAELQPRRLLARGRRVVLRAMKRYGLILADNGSNWYFQGAPTARWPPRSSPS